METKLSDDTMVAIRKALVSCNKEKHEQAFEDLSKFLHRVEGLPKNKRDTLMLGFPKVKSSFSKDPEIVITLSIGSYALIYKKDDGLITRLVLLKRLGGQAKSFFDSSQPGVTDSDLVYKAIGWMDKTISSLEEI